eukprot:CAMPEP_0197234254 /NCGR_PEP_ID=MMETSP1429-20130617/2042_1 /TAXON_ID=49237 /ORGANISM="Chaetoceros  sp., Strain UNC1202" /LENGTH=123 /DNA_ID=CAMNT_0042692609 /DNA_START=74 /DNA_END=445 /DNA_ORIENTATION=+
MPSIAPLATILSLVIANTAMAQEDCPCFSRKDLDSHFNAVNIDNDASCRESHSTGSGIGIWLNQNKSESGFHEIFGYNVNISNLECLVEGDMILTLPDVERAETCAQFIRDKCAEIGSQPVEY